jgi:hypothetical protein
MEHKQGRRMKISGVSLVICTLAVYACSAQESIHIPDPRLKTIVEHALWVWDPTPADMLGLTSLNLSSRKIKDLTGLEYAKNLQTLQLTHNQVKDLSPLSTLTNLRTLVPNNNQIKDLSPLSGLTQLRVLNIHENQIADVTPLAGLQNLEYLDLHENQVRSISGLSGLHNLQHLDLNLNQIEDLYPLSGLRKLAYLNLSYNRITDLSALSGLGNLSTLCLYNNQISDISTLSGLTSLSVLRVHNNPLGQQVCDIYVSKIIANNPDMQEFRYDLCANQYPLVEEIRPARKIHVNDDAVNDPGPDDASIGDPQEDGTADHPYDSIQEAIEQARDHDKILVHAGTYYETLNLMGKCLAISGYSHDVSKLSSYPVVDAQGRGTVVTFTQAEGPTCILSGLVLTGGRHNNSGAIACIGASPTIKNCLIVGNRSTGPAGAIIYCEQSRSLFENLTVSGNSSAGNGAAFRFTDCDATIANSILWQNAPGEITVASGKDPSVVCSDVQGTWPGFGNIGEDPLFALPSYRAESGDAGVAWTPEDYHLLSEIGRWNPDSLTWTEDELTSPCIDAGDPSNAWADEPRPHGARINMGAYGGTDQASCSLHDVPIIARWAFAESSGNTAYDGAGDKHGTVHGASWTEGLLDGALQFDGIDDYVDCGNDPALAPDLFTISMWIYAQASSGSRSILRKAGGGKDRDYDFKLFAARNPTFSFGNGSQSAVLHSNSVIPPNEWTHITLTRDETEAAIHVNGAQLMRKTYDFAPSATHHKLIIGGASLQPFLGKIDDVQIYDSVLSAEEIESLGCSEE